MALPVFPPAALRKQYGLEEMTVKPDGSLMKVRLAKPDTDFVLVFDFEHRGCWQLVRYENQSLQ